MDHGGNVLELGKYEEGVGASRPGCADFVILPAVVTFWREMVRVQVKERWVCQIP